MQSLQISGENEKGEGANDIFHILFLYRSIGNLFTGLVQENGLSPW